MNLLALVLAAALRCYLMARMGYDHGLSIFAVAVELYNNFKDISVQAPLWAEPIPISELVFGKAPAIITSLPQTVKSVSTYVLGFTSKDVTVFQLGHSAPVCMIFEYPGDLFGVNATSDLVVYTGRSPNPMYIAEHPGIDGADICTSPAGCPVNSDDGSKDDYPLDTPYGIDVVFTDVCRWSEAPLIFDLESSGTCLLTDLPIDLEAVTGDEPQTVESCANIDSGSRNPLRALQAQALLILFLSAFGVIATFFNAIFDSILPGYFCMVAPPMKVAVELDPALIPLPSNGDDELLSPLDRSFLCTSGNIDTPEQKTEAVEQWNFSIDPALVPLPEPLGDELVVDPLEVPLPDSDDDDLAVAEVTMPICLSGKGPLPLSKSIEHSAPLDPLSEDCNAFDVWDASIQSFHTAVSSQSIAMESQTVTQRTEASESCVSIVDLMFLDEPDGATRNSVIPAYITPSLISHVFGGE